MIDTEFIDVKISKECFDEVNKIVAQSSQCQTVSEFVNFILKELLFGDSDSQRTETEDSVLKKRLQDLGYM